MYKFDKTIFKAQSFADSERENVFEKTVPLSERLNQGWYLTAMAHGIDPYHPPIMIKKFVSTRKHKR
jgi:hypothetical protein